MSPGLNLLEGKRRQLKGVHLIDVKRVGKLVRVVGSPVGLPSADVLKGTWLFLTQRNPLVHLWEVRKGIPRGATAWVDRARCLDVVLVVWCQVDGYHMGSSLRRWGWKPLDDGLVLLDWR